MEPSHDTLRQEEWHKQAPSRLLTHYTRDFSVSPKPQLDLRLAKSMSLLYRYGCQSLFTRASELPLDEASYSPLEGMGPTGALHCSLHSPVQLSFLHTAHFSVVLSPSHWFPMIIFWFFSLRKNLLFDILPHLLHHITQRQLFVCRLTLNLNYF